MRSCKADGLKEFHNETEKNFTKKQIEFAERRVAIHARVDQLLNFYNRRVPRHEWDALCREFGYANRSSLKNIWRVVESTGSGSRRFGSGKRKATKEISKKKKLKQNTKEPCDSFDIEEILSI